MAEELLAKAYVKGALDLLQGKIDGMPKIVIIPDNATNKDVIKAVFPNARVSDIFPICNCDEVYYILIEKADGVTNEMRVMKSWLNAPYKRGTE